MTADWSEVVESLTAHLRDSGYILAAGSFGSINRKQEWPYSDLDILVVTTEAEAQAQAVYFHWLGRLVHTQLLSASSLQSALARNSYAFLSVVESVNVWFDHNDVLRTAISYAQTVLADAVEEKLLPARLTAAISALHSAEKYQTLGKSTAAQAALVVATGDLAAAELIQSGRRPAKDVWATEGVASLPAYVLYRRAVNGTDLSDSIHLAWDEARDLLDVGTRPIVIFVDQQGPVSYMQLEQARELAGLTLTERLIIEMVGQGLLVEQVRRHTLLGVDEVLYTAK